MTVAILSSYASLESAYCVKNLTLAILFVQNTKMHSAVISDWRTASAPNVITTLPSTSTSYSSRYSGPPSISFHQQQRHTSKSGGATLRSRGRISLNRKDVFRVSGLAGSSIFGKQLSQVAVPRRSLRRVQAPVALQQYENENGATDFAPALKPRSIEIDSLPPFVRDSTMKAVDDLGRRVTVGDVASRAGLKLTQAETALQALAADSGGFLEVFINSTLVSDYLIVLPHIAVHVIHSSLAISEYEELQ